MDEDMFLFAKQVQRACAAAGHHVVYAADLDLFVRRMSTRASLHPNNFLELYDGPYNGALARGCSVCGSAARDCVGAIALTDDPVKFFPFCVPCSTGSAGDVIRRVIGVLDGCAPWTPRVITGVKTQ